MNLEKVDEEFDRFNQVKQDEDKSRFDYYITMSNEYLRLQKIIINLPPIIDEYGLSKETLVRNKVTNDLELLLRYIKSEMIGYYIENNVLELNNIALNIQKMTMYHSNSITVEKFLSDLYELKCGKHLEVLIALKNTIKTSKEWCHIVNNLDNVAIEYISSKQLMVNLRAVLDDRIIKKSNTNIEYEKESNTFAKTIKEFFLLPFFQRQGQIIDEEEINNLVLFLTNSKITKFKRSDKLDIFIKVNKHAILYYLSVLNGSVPDISIESVIPHLGKDKFAKRLKEAFIGIDSMSYGNINKYLNGSYSNQSMLKILHKVVKDIDINTIEYPSNIAFVKSIINAGKHW